MTNAAALLVKVKTKLGKSVPEYAKKLAANPSSGRMDRAERELYDLLTSMRSTTRRELFAEHADLNQWFADQTVEV